MTDDLDTEVEIGGQPSHDGELLVVLLSEHRAIGPGRSEQLGDHGGDTVEVARARRTLHRVGQSRDPDPRREVR